MTTKPIHILNGPNLNTLGTREPHIYGTATLDDIHAELTQHADPFTLVFQQTNHEGELVEQVHTAAQEACGLIINAAAYTHTSLALLDALKLCSFPIVEVHLSQIFGREEARHHSYVAPVATAIVAGFGAQSYLLALQGLKHHLT